MVVRQRSAMHARYDRYQGGQSESHGKVDSECQQHG